MSSYKRPLQIVYANKKDLDLIFQMIKESALFHKLEKKFTATKSSYRKSFFADPKGPDVLIVKANNKPVGIAVFYETFATFPGQKGFYIEDLYIRSQYRGLGYGTALFKKICQIAKKRNCKLIEWKVYNLNQSASLFYKKFKPKTLTDWTTFTLFEKGLNSLL